MASPTQEDFEKLYKTLQSQLNKTSTGFGSVISALGRTVPVIGGATLAIKSLADAVNDAEGSYRKLSSSGANFSNDLIGMNNAALRSRTDLTNFAELISKNGRNLAGLGANVTRGAENFAKLASDMHANDSVLRQMGYTTDEMNQLLIDQIGINRVVNSNDSITRKRIADSTVNFAKELDLTSKLTGKNRSELAEQMRERGSAARMDASIKLATRGMDKEHADIVKNNIKQLQAQAGTTGMEQAFKELVETGTVYSDAAKQQAALGGKAFDEMAQSVQLAKKGHTDEATERMKNATALAAELQDNPAMLAITAASGAMGGVGETLTNMAADMKPIVDSMHNLAESTSVILQSEQDYIGIFSKMLTDARAAQKGERPTEDGAYAKVGQLAEIATGMEKTKDELFSGAAEAFDKHLAPSLHQILDPLANNVPTAVHDSVVTAGNDIANAFKSQLSAEGGLVDTIGAAGTTFIENIVKGIDGEVVPNLTKWFQDALTSINQSSNKSTNPTETTPSPASTTVAPRDTGSFGKTGSLWENFGKGTQMLLHGIESVITPSQYDNIVSNSFESGMASVMTEFNNIAQAIPQAMSIAPVVDIKTNEKTDTNFMYPDTNAVDYTKLSGETKQVYPGINPVDYNKLSDEFDKKLNSLLNPITGKNKKQEKPTTTQKIPAQIEDAKKQLDKIVPSDTNTKKTAEPMNVSKDGKVNLNAFSMDDNGLPILKQAQPSTAADNKQSSTAPAQQQQSDQQKQTTAQQQATQQVAKQTDVMGSMLDELKRLNEQFSTYLNQHERLVKKQISATKQNSGNLYHG